MLTHRRLALLAAVLLPTSAMAAELVNDSFDLDTSANWNIVRTNAGQTPVNFAWDYSALGIPSSPRSTGGSTRGLRMAANINAGTTHALTLSPIGVNIADASKGVLLTFDMWINANGPFPDGGTGSTEFLTAGVGYDGTTVNRPSNLSGSGGWFAVSGEGGAARDFRAAQGALEQLAYDGGGNPVRPEVYQAFFAPNNVPGLEQDNSHPVYVAAFPGASPPAAQLANYPQQTGALDPGSVGFAWRKVDIIGRGTTVKWYIDGLLVATLDTTIGPAFSITGNVSIGYADPFSSISNNVDLSFGLVDNVGVYALSSLGDVNDDGVVNNQDIAPFVAALTGGGVLRPDIAFAADVNGDGVVNNQDIAPFVTLLTGGRPLSDLAGDPDFAPLVAMVPEPASLSLLALGALALRRRRSRS
jgi:hypothetical protein